MKTNTNLTKRETFDISKANNIFVYLTLMGEYIRDWKNKTYRRFPTAGVVTTIIVIVWWISPIDLDFIPYIGWIDDVIGMPMAFIGAWRYELNMYKAWREGVNA